MFRNHWCRPTMLCVVSILYLMGANARPLSCKEDAHCSEGYYCETQMNVCFECLHCQDFKRDPPMSDVSNACIKSIDSCGPCSTGFVNIYRKCVIPEFFEFGSISHYTYVWMIAAVVGVFVVVTFVYVIKHTGVFRVVAYSNLVTETSSPVVASSVSIVVMSPRHLLKCLMHLHIKNSSNE